MYYSALLNKLPCLNLFHISSFKISRENNPADSVWACQAEVPFSRTQWSETTTFSYYPKPLLSMTKG